MPNAPPCKPNSGARRPNAAHQRADPPANAARNADETSEATNHAPWTKQKANVPAELNPHPRAPHRCTSPKHGTQCERPVRARIPTASEAGRTRMPALYTKHARGAAAPVAADARAQRPRAAASPIPASHVRDARAREHRNAVLPIAAFRAHAPTHVANHPVCLRQRGDVAIPATAPYLARTPQPRDNAVPSVASRRAHVPHHADDAVLMPLPTTTPLLTRLRIAAAQAGALAPRSLASPRGQCPRSAPRASCAVAFRLLRARLRGRCAKLRKPRRPPRKAVSHPGPKHAAAAPSRSVAPAARKRSASAATGAIARRRAGPDAKRTSHGRAAGRRHPPHRSVPAPVAHAPSTVTTRAPQAPYGVLLRRGEDAEQTFCEPLCELAFQDQGAPPTRANASPTEAPIVSWARRSRRSPIPLPQLPSIVRKFF